MLHSMRRSSFFWGFLKFVVYLILFAAPIWFYLTYVSGTLDNLVTAMNKAQGTAAQAQDKFDGFESAVKTLQSQLPAFMQPHTSTSSISTQ